MKIDLHTHSSRSDGTDSPAELIFRAAALGLSTVALTDHDTFAGLEEAAEVARRVRIGFVPGAEFSTSFDDRHVHLLGYWVDQENAALLAEMQAALDSRVNRLPLTLGKLADLGMSISVEDVLAQATNSVTLGRPHVADALVAKGYVANRTQAFAEYLATGGPAYVKSRYTPLIEMIELIHNAGGVAILAHPLAKGRGELSFSEVERLVSEFGVDGFEVDHQDHSQQERAVLREIGDSLGSIMTGSSDYHGTGKLNHELACNTTSVEMLERLRQLAVLRQTSLND